MKQLLLVTLMMLAIIAGCKKDNKQSLATLTTTDATTITANSATTGGDITGDGGSSVTKRGVCYATHATPTVSDSVTADGSGTGTFTSPLTGLYSHTQYFVRAYAINASGTAYGNEIRFNTGDGVPAVTTAPVTNLVPLKAQSGGNVISDGGSTITARGLVYSTSPHPTITDFKTATSGTTGSFIDSLTPLASSTTYYVRAYATNGLGTGYGNEIQFTSVSADAVTDIDGNVYGYIKIGDQTWMTSNLKVSHYRNGDPITDGFANNSAFYRTIFTVLPATGAYTYPNQDPVNNRLFGKYYDNITISDSREICPDGWHIPTDYEWNILEVDQGISPSDTSKFNDFVGSIGAKLLDNGSSGLNLQLAGSLLLDPGGPQYNSFGLPSNGGAGFYWSSTSNDNLNLGLAKQYLLRAFYLSGDPNPIYRSATGSYAMSVRCMKD